jgi:protease-4
MDQQDQPRESSDSAPAVGSPVSPHAPPQVIIQQGGGLLLRIFASLGWIGFLFCALLAIGQFAALGQYFDTSGGITEKHHSLSKFASDKIAVISVKGVILSGGGYVKHQIDRVRRDKNVKAIVLRVDSPGGTVTGSDYILHHLNKLREDRELPLVVSMGSIAASGGYYVSMAVGDQEDSIFAEPTTTTGSIGVMIPHYDVSGLMERFDVKDDTLATHPRKEMLSMTKPMPDDHRAILEQYLDEAFTRFKEIVRQGRPAFRGDEGILDELATGEVFTAGQAVEHGLVDRIGFVEEAIDRAIEMAGLDKEKTRVVEFERPVTLLDLGFIQSRQGRYEGEWLDLATPRAYYLWTMLPPLMAGR